MVKALTHACTSYKLFFDLTSLPPYLLSAIKVLTELEAWKARSVVRIKPETEPNIMMKRMKSTPSQSSRYWRSLEVSSYLWACFLAWRFFIIWSLK